jgi:hypothetical protein
MRDAFAAGFHSFGNRAARRQLAGELGPEFQFRLDPADPGFTGLLIRVSFCTWIIASVRSLPNCSNCAALFVSSVALLAMFSSLNTYLCA